MSELKPLPCPFCGGIGAYQRDFHMCCQVCGAEGQDGDSSHESAAIEAWNRRAQPAQAGQVLTVDDLWTSDTIMALNAELGLSIDQIAKFARAIEQAVLAKRVPMTEALHTFLDAAAGEGLMLNGVDAADLYIAVFPDRYAKAVGEKGGA